MEKGISDKKFEEIEKIREETKSLFEQLLEQSEFEDGDIVVVGCSSSEVAGEKIGTYSSKEIGEVIVETLYEECCKHHLHLAAQCCEHLNRALVIEKNIAKKRNYEIVSVVPKLKAGGALATAAYNNLPEAVIVEHIKADLGIDIGDVMIGMHLKDVAVPVRTNIRQIGAAHVVCAKTRPKLIGGERAEYN